MSQKGSVGSFLSEDARDPMEQEYVQEIQGCVHAKDIRAPNDRLMQRRIISCLRQVRS